MPTFYTYIIIYLLLKGTVQYSSSQTFLKQVLYNFPEEKSKKIQLPEQDVKATNRDCKKLFLK